MTQVICSRGSPACCESEPCYLCMRVQRDTAIARSRELELLLFDLDGCMKVNFIGKDILDRIRKAIGGGGTYTQVCRCGAKITQEGHACGYWQGPSGGQLG